MNENLGEILSTCIDRLIAGATLEEGVNLLVRSDTQRNAREHLGGLQGEGTQLGDALLRATKTRSGDHLHRARDLLRRFDRRDALPDRFQ